MREWLAVDLNTSPASAKTRSTKEHWSHARRPINISTCTETTLPPLGLLTNYAQIILFLSFILAILLLVTYYSHIVLKNHPKNSIQMLPLIHYTETLQRVVHSPQVLRMSLLRAKIHVYSQLRLAGPMQFVERQMPSWEVGACGLSTIPEHQCWVLHHLLQLCSTVVQTLDSPP